MLLVVPPVDHTSRDSQLIPRWGLMDVVGMLAEGEKRDGPGLWERKGVGQEAACAQPGPR